MGAQFDRVVLQPETSLTLIVEDMMRQRFINAPAPEGASLEDWLNALHLQKAPLVHSEAGRANLEAWLEAVEQQPAP